MDVVYLSGEQLQLSCLPYGRSGQYSASFLLKQAFRIENGKIAIPLPDDEDPVCPSGDRRAGDEREAGLYYASDFAPLKPRADVVLNATAHAPAGLPVSTLDVRMQVGALTKTLRVFGERRWKSTLVGEKVSPPDPFTQIPITYNNGYGGADWQQNPQGKGRGRDAEFLPHVELPNQPTQSRRDDIQPAGFSPIDSSWPQRRSLLGTYDEHWREERWPWYPEDFDFGFFNAAPLDQQVDGYLRGDETLEFENLHPNHPLYRSQLPGLKARCFLYERSAGRRSIFREVPLVLDTLWIDLNIERIELVWRGNTSVRSPKLKGIERTVIATEALAADQTAEQYRQAMHAHLAAEDADFDVEIDEDPEANAKVEREMKEMEAEFSAMEKEFQALEADATAEVARIHEHHMALGVDPAIFERPPAKSIAIPQMVNQIQQVRDVNPNLADEFVALNAEAAQADASVEQFDEEFAAAEAQFADDPPWTRERVAAFHEAGEPIAGVDLDRLDLSGLSLAGGDFQAVSLRKANLSNADLSGANFRGADFTDADLTGANFSGAILDGAEFSRALLDGAALTKVSIDGADFSRLHLKNQDFTGARGKYAEFTEADLSGAKFCGAVFDGVDFDKANLEMADFQHAVLKECDFDGANAAGAVFEKGDLTNMRCEGADFAAANLRGVSAAGSVWEKCVLDRADLSRGVFENSEFGEVSAKATIFDRTDCTECNFEDAQLEEAQLTNCNLLRASFARAHMRRASLAGSNCFEANFFEARLKNCNLKATNLKMTLLAGQRHG